MAENEPAYKMVEDGLVTVKQASEFLNISIAGVYAAMGRGELAYVKLGRSRRVPRRALAELAAKNLVVRDQRHPAW
jgi:excisionase family DNA binding protein